MTRTLMVSLNLNLDVISVNIVAIATTCLIISILV